MVEALLSSWVVRRVKNLRIFAGDHPFMCNEDLVTDARGAHGWVKFKG